MLDGLAGLLAERHGLAGTTTAGQLTVEVPAAGWLAAARALRADADCDFFDWLSAYEETDGTLAVVLHVASVAGGHHLLARTRVPGEDPRLPSLAGVWAGAAWHERETWEMFGVTFDGHPHLAPLLLPDGFAGTPLRKAFTLAPRVDTPWPGAHDPSGRARRRPGPPGT